MQTSFNFLEVHAYHPVAAQNVKNHRGPPRGAHFDHICHAPEDIKKNEAAKKEDSNRKSSNDEAINIVKTTDAVEEEVPLSSRVVAGSTTIPTAPFLPGLVRPIHHTTARRQVIVLSVRDAPPVEEPFDIRNLAIKNRNRRCNKVNVSLVISPVEGGGGVEGSGGGSARKKFGMLPPLATEMTSSHLDDRVPHHRVVAAPPPPHLETTADQQVPSFVLGPIQQQHSRSKQLHNEMMQHNAPSSSNLNDHNGPSGALKLHRRQNNNISWAVEASAQRLEVMERIIHKDQHNDKAMEIEKKRDFVKQLNRDLLDEKKRQFEEAQKEKERLIELRVRARQKGSVNVPALAFQRVTELNLIL